jgi:DNA-binding response OmpR family regulator
MAKLADALASRMPRIQTREMLIEYVYRNGYAIEYRTIDTLVKKFRKMLPKDCPIKIVTHYGIGYAMVFEEDAQTNYRWMYKR